MTKRKPPQQQPFNPNQPFETVDERISKAIANADKAIAAAAEIRRLLKQKKEEQ